MPRITLYLDKETETLVTQAAKAKGLSKSRRIAQAIRHALDSNTISYYFQNDEQVVNWHSDRPLQKRLITAQPVVSVSK